MATTTYKVGNEWTHSAYLNTNKGIKKVSNRKYRCLQDFTVVDPNKGYKCSDHGDDFTLRKGDIFTVDFCGNAHSMGIITVC